MVIERLDGPILRYSMRLELMSNAAQLGISRFDAALVIAQVQHRAAGARFQHGGDESPAAAPLYGYLPFAVAVIVQLSILAGAWAIIS